jgi:hypothetical protein
VLQRSDLGAHHVLTVLGKPLPFPALAVDTSGHALRVRTLGYVRHPKVPSLSVLRVVWDADWPRPMAFQGMVQITDPNLQGLEEGAAQLVGAFRALARAAFHDYRLALRPMSHPKWLRRSRKHQRNQ